MRRQSLPDRDWPGGPVIQRDCGGRGLGGSVAGFNAFVGKIVWKRLSGWLTRTTPVNATTGLPPGGRQSICALAGFRDSAGRDCAGGWTPVRFVREYAGDYRGVALAGDSGPQSDWFRRRGFDPRIAERERPGSDPGPAALRSCADLRSRRD